MGTEIKITKETIRGREAAFADNAEYGKSVVARVSIEIIFPLFQLENRSLVAAEWFEKVFEVLNDR